MLVESCLARIAINNLEAGKQYSLFVPLDLSSAFDIQPVPIRYCYQDYSLRTLGQGGTVNEYCMVSMFTVSCTPLKDKKPQQMHIYCNTCFCAFSFVWKKKEKPQLFLFYNFPTNLPRSEKVCLKLMKLLRSS